MELSTIIILIGIILVNGTTLFSAWVKVKTELASLKIEITDLDERLKAQEGRSIQMIENINQKLEKVDDTNVRQHDIILTKIDTIKDSITDLKVLLAETKKIK